MKDKLYFVVSVDGGEAPKAQHTNFAKAAREARRLTRLTGRRARILMQVGATFPMGGPGEEGQGAKGSLLVNFISGAYTWSKELQWRIGRRNVGPSVTALETFMAASMGEVDVEVAHLQDEVLITAGVDAG